MLRREGGNRPDSRQLSPETIVESPEGAIAPAEESGHCPGLSSRMTRWGAQTYNIVWTMALYIYKKLFY